MFESSCATGLLGMVVDGMRTFQPAGDAAEMVDQLQLLEQLKAAACAVQAELAAGLVGEGDSPPSSERLRSVGAQVGLARRESPHRGRSLTNLGTVLAIDLPHTMGLLRAGLINERRAMIVATECHDLSHADRLTLDRELSGPGRDGDQDARPGRLADLGDREALLAARRIALRLDQASALERRARAHARRGVVGRLLPDGMGQITATVSDIDYHQIMGSLDQQAATRRAAGDAAAATAAARPDLQPDHVADSTRYAGRSHAQLMADEFVARLLGEATARSVNLNLVMSAEALLDEECDEPADVVDRTGTRGPIPASLARWMVFNTFATPAMKASIRRLFTVPGTDTLVAMDSRSRTFDGALAAFLRLRDQVCRTPWCNGSVKHGDHITRHADGGATAAVNGNGLCEACNYTKEAAGWSHALDPTTGFDHTVHITTPTGHRYRSRAPGQPPAAHRARVPWVEFITEADPGFVEIRLG